MYRFSGKMTLLIRISLQLAILLILSSCSNSPKYVQPAYSSTAHCSVYQNLPTSSLCYTYWGNKDTSCDNVIRNEFSKRNVSASNATCGQPLNNLSSASCIRISSMNSSEICKAYWDNSNTACDQTMRQELEKRNLQITPRAVCGLPKCSDLSNFTPSEICNRYWSNSNVACDGNIREEFAKRKLEIYPKNLCGRPSVTNENTNVTPLKEPPSSNGSGTNKPSVSKKCESVIDSISTSNNSVKAACELRYKSLSKESILCRSEIVSFINMNSSGVGTDISSCGSR